MHNLEYTFHPIQLSKTSLLPNFSQSTLLRLAAADTLNIIFGDYEQYLRDKKTSISQGQKKSVDENGLSQYTPERVRITQANLHLK